MQNRTKNNIQCRINEAAPSYCAQKETFGCHVLVNGSYTANRNALAFALALALALALAIEYTGLFPE